MKSPPQQDRSPDNRQPGDTEAELRSREQTGQESLQKLGEMTEEIGNQTEELFERLKETAEGMKKAREKELSDKLEQEGAPENRQSFSNSLGQIQQNLQGGRLRQSFDEQQQFAGGMQKMNQRLEQYREELAKEWQGKVAEAMKRAFDELSYLSESQEEILLRVEAEPDFNHPDILRYATRQQEVVAGLESVRGALVEAAKDNFFISVQLLDIVSTAVQLGEQSRDKLEDEVRQKAPTLSDLKNSLVVINAGMLTLLQDSQNLQESASAMGMDQMLKQMEEMLRRQQELNNQTQSAASNMESGQKEGQPMPGATGSGQSQSPGDMLEMLRQMAAEQESIRQQIEELARQMAGRKDLFGSGLEGAAKDAEEAAKDLQQRQINPQTLDRQRRIIQRLLDAQKSIQDREEGRERKAERPGDFTVVPPDALDSGLLKRPEDEDAFRKALERWQGTYPESYESLIREYYELLRQKNLGN